jgi:hypothetical protein
MVFMATLNVDRVFLNSAVRRGRLAVSPVWQVRLADGAIWQFLRKRDAQAFAAAGGCTHEPGTPSVFWCITCGGRRVQEGWLR